MALCLYLSNSKLQGLIIDYQNSKSNRNSWILNFIMIYSAMVTSQTLIFLPSWTICTLPLGIKTCSRLLWSWTKSPIFLIRSSNQKSRPLPFKPRLCQTWLSRRKKNLSLADLQKTESSTALLPKAQSRASSSRKRIGMWFPTCLESSWRIYWKCTPTIIV